MEIANEILRQLGGNRFVVMTGARNLIGHPNALSFRIGRNDRGVNYVKITLNAMDTYDMEFLSIRGLNSSVKGYREGVYNDQLRAVFTSETGLETSLGTMGKAAR